MYEITTYQNVHNESNVIWFVQNWQVSGKIGYLVLITSVTNRLLGNSR